MTKTIPTEVVRPIIRRWRRENLLDSDEARVYGHLGGSEEGDGQAGEEDILGPSMARAVRRVMSGEHASIGFFTLDSMLVAMGYGAYAWHCFPELQPFNGRSTS